MSEEMEHRLNRFEAALDDVRVVNRRIVATLVRLEGKVDDMGAQMATSLATKDDISRVMNHVDGLARKVEDFTLRLGGQGRALDDHDSRFKP
jgi:chromosome segregation ATPase